MKTNGIVGKLRERRSGGWGPRQSEVEDDYFKVRGFKNGNAHVWFKRDDLVEQVNKLLAEWYGETIGDGMTREPDPLDDRKTAIAKGYGFYATPAELVDRIIDKIPIWPF